MRLKEKKSSVKKTQRKRKQVCTSLTSVFEFVDVKSDRSRCCCGACHGGGGGRLRHGRKHGFPPVCLLRRLNRPVASVRNRGRGTTLHWGYVQKIESYQILLTPVATDAKPHDDISPLVLVVKFVCPTSLREPRVRFYMGERFACEEKRGPTKTSHSR